MVTAVDIALDPVMVAARYWIWQVNGAFFGVPARNYFGWWLTTLIILRLYLYFSRVGLKQPLGCSR